MSRIGIVGKSAVALAIGAVGALAALKVRDERYVAGIWDTLEQTPSAGAIASLTLLRS